MKQQIIPFISLLLLVMAMAPFAAAGAGRRNRRNTFYQGPDNNEVRSPRNDIEEFRKALKTREAIVEESSINHVTSLSTASSSPSCLTDSALVYVNTRLSFEKTFDACLGQIADPTLLPTMDNGTLTGPTHVTTSIVLNNLHLV